MPQVRLEYSNNVKLRDHQLLFSRIHQILAETLPTKISSCKSRAVICDHYLVGDGKTDNGFVHLLVAVLKGRSKEVLTITADKLLETLSNFLADQRQDLNIDISVEISELPDAYLNALR